MSDDLVKRLRNPPFGTETSERNLMESAADRLEKQAAEITRLRARVAELEDIIRAVHRNAKNLAGDRTFDQCITALMRIDDLCRSALGGKDE